MNKLTPEQQQGQDWANKIQECRRWIKLIGILTTRILWFGLLVLLGWTVAKVWP